MAHPVTPVPVSGRLRALAPGAGTAAACAGLAHLLHAAVPVLSPLVVAVALGLAVGNVARWRTTLEPGSHAVARSVLRVGVVLLGFRLAAGDALRLGVRGFALVLAVVLATFLGTLALGRRLGLGRGLSTLTATGFAICGASAIAAMDGVVDADEEEVTYAIGLVTLCGTLAIVALPLLARPLGLAGEEFGTWAGASVHDVGQVVATASTQGSAALAAAVLVKLTRVVLLGPLVAVMSILRRRRHRADTTARPVRRAPIVPWFVLAFLAAIALRSSAVLPDWLLAALRLVEAGCFAVALAALGMGVDVARLRRLGHRPLVLGLASWVMIGAVSYAGVRLTS